ncbi:MAG TPA: helix-turn-helix domain-containing protein [Chthoniobacterales bacterium]
MSETPENDKRDPRGDSPGKRLEAARQRSGWTIDDVARMTKMRPGQIRDLEADNYKNFANLAYAKSFLKMYGRFLRVDLSDVIDRLHLPERIGIEHYQYLNAPREEEPPHRPGPRARRTAASQTLRSGSGVTAKWLIFGVISLPIVAFLAVFAVNLQRLDLGKTGRVGGDTAGESSSSTPSLESPSAKPGAATPVPESGPNTETTPHPRPLPVHTPDAPGVFNPAGTPDDSADISSPTVSPSPAPSEPEIRRAEPVRPLPQ